MLPAASPGQRLAMSSPSAPKRLTVSYALVLATATTCTLPAVSCRGNAAASSSAATTGSYSSPCTPAVISTVGPFREAVMVLMCSFIIWSAACGRLRVKNFKFLKHLPRYFPVALRIGMQRVIQPVTVNRSLWLVFPMFVIIHQHHGFLHSHFPDNGNIIRQAFSFGGAGGDNNIGCVQHGDRAGF